jgi:hypothetical protein
MKIDLVSLDECPEGLFLFNGTLCFKSEYHTQSQVTGYSQCDAYVVSSGEYFWGGASTAEARDNLLVTPVPADHIDALTAERDKWKALAVDLADPEDCFYDHHGYCQEHLLHERPCPHEQVKAALREQD